MVTISFENIAILSDLKDCVNLDVLMAIVSTLLTRQDKKLSNA